METIILSDGSTVKGIVTSKYYNGICWSGLYNGRYVEKDIINGHWKTFCK